MVIAGGIHSRLRHGSGRQAAGGGRRAPTARVRQGGHRRRATCCCMTRDFVDPVLAEIEASCGIPAIERAGQRHPHAPCSEHLPRARLRSRRDLLERVQTGDRQGGDRSRRQRCRHHVRLQTGRGEDGRHEQPAAVERRQHSTGSGRTTDAVRPTGPIRSGPAGAGVSRLRPGNSGDALRPFDAHDRRAEPGTCVRPRSTAWPPRNSNGTWATVAFLEGAAVPRIVWRSNRPRR